MRTLIFTLAAAAFLAAGCVSAPRYDDPDTQAASALAHRLLGKTADRIEFRLTEADADVFRLSSRGSRIVIEGNNANSMAVGLNHYLKYYCLVNVGWFSWDRIDMPRKLPKVAEPVEVKARVEDRFFLNYCTYGYTMPWWQWSEWEHFIDWMALQGINLPLAITGQEAIWYKIWTEMGLTDEEVRTYFTGPAHLPWHRMLNIDHWGSPLPMSWLDGQAELQKKIVARERELNMRPVLPAFAGHVPPELNRIYPEAQIERMSDWAGFDLEDYPYFLDPMDPLFPVIQKKFVEKETEIYGTDHIYGIDLFNEMIPKSWEPDYLSRVSRQCYESLAAVDPDAVWLQMTWLFWNERKYWTQDRIEPYITSYPAENARPRATTACRSSGATWATSAATRTWPATSRTSTSASKAPSRRPARISRASAPPWKASTATRSCTSSSSRRPGTSRSTRTSPPMDRRWPTAGWASSASPAGKPGKPSWTRSTWTVPSPGTPPS